jgi:hypothetical protein
MPNHLFLLQDVLNKHGAATTDAIYVMKRCRDAAVSEDWHTFKYSVKLLKVISLSHLFQNRGLINYAHKEGEKEILWLI